MNNRSITLIDSTLRDGAQGCDVAFSLEQKLRIVEMLTTCGISIIEAGIPVMGAPEQKTIRKIKKQFPAMHLVGWCRGKKEDIDAAEVAECDSVHISLPASAIHQKVTGLQPQEVLDSCEKAMVYAKPIFGSVSIGAQDASRADFEFLIALIKCAMEYGASRVRIADTVGVLTPLATVSLFSRLLSRIPNAQLEFHGHNDLGMATANTITAIESGACSASVTLCGLGERAGNAALEEVAVALNSNPLFSTGVNLQHLKHTCTSVYEITGQQTPFHKPVIGDGAFKHTSGIHCNALLKDSRSYEPYPPEQVGQKREFMAGSHSGTTGVVTMLSRKGIYVSKTEAREIIRSIREISETCQRPLTSEELLIHYSTRVKRGYSHDSVKEKL